MKKAIFTEAWRLVKLYNVSLSVALQTAWIEFKSDLIMDKINMLELKQGIENRFEIEKLTAYVAPMIIKLRELRSKLVLNVPFDNSGARYDYGIGIYNGD